MTLKQAIKSHRDRAKKNAKLAAKYAEQEDYAEAARWYGAADYHFKLANGLVGFTQS